MQEQKQKRISLILAIVTALCLASIGIFIAEESIIGILTALLGAVVTTGIGFTLRKKWREQNQQ